MKHWILCNITPVTTVGVKVRAIGRASPDSPPYFIGRFSDGKKFIKQIPELYKHLISEGRAPCNETTLKNAMNCFIAHTRNNIRETKGVPFPGIHLKNGRLVWIDDSNGLVLPQFDLAADEQKLLVNHLNQKCTEEEIQHYFQTLELLTKSLPELWQAQLALTVSHGAVCHFASALKANDIAIGPYCLVSEQHGFKTPCIEIASSIFGRGKLYASPNFETTFRQNAILSVPGPIGVDEKSNDKLKELIKVNASGSFEGIRGRADGSGMRIPLPAVFQNATNGEFVGEDDEGNGLRARVVVFRSSESKDTSAHPKYGEWMTELRGPVSGAAGKWLLLRIADRINQMGVQNFAKRAKDLSQKLLSRVGYTKRAETLAVCLLFMEIIRQEVKNLAENGN